MGMQKNYSENEIIIQENAPSRYMYIVLKGQVALYSNYGKDDEYLFCLVGKGKTFGEIGLLNHEDSIYTAVAISDVQLAIFSEHELGAFIRKYPDQALGVMRSIARMNQVFNVNLRMMLEENREFMKYRSIYVDAYKHSAANTEDSDGEPNEDELKWNAFKDFL